MGKHTTQRPLFDDLPKSSKKTRAEAAPRKAVAASSKQVALIAEPARHLRVIQDVEDYERPRTFGDCERMVGDGPCPYVSCRHHLFFETDSGTKSHGRRLAGSIGISSWSEMREHIPDHEFEMAAEEIVSSGREWCSLKIAAQNPDGLMLEDVGAAMDITPSSIAS